MIFGYEAVHTKSGSSCDVFGIDGVVVTSLYSLH